ncbi:DIS3-like exonuclease 2 [Zancudomyces culisetae]|uniref:DIS3-like exonuclease 2 n=1 Tax=Zancudomyces culisetae TaxID=1213189 RepID=A0A1R1PUC4_ZANCU|nr:DIS3-like exonuclease 2 [Zancudomyces culisetae]|eukprot:OMH84503.1 DIS3-like exonuclease 2 [Zancudomyces culisetae]
MLLANKYVAETLYKKLGRLGLLRRHGPPLSSRLQASADILNLPISTQSNCLAESIHSSVNNIADPEYKRLVIHILTSAMRNAVYFCPSNIVHPADYHHFALNSNFYTHFTSPLRRYPDLIVHRMLLFNHAQLPKLSDLDSIVHLCNLKSMRSRLIQRLLERTAVHSHLFSSFDSPLCLTAHITRLYETKFSFVILDYNIEDDIQLNSLSISTHSNSNLNSNSNLTASLDLWVYNYHFRSLSLLLNFTHSKQSKSPTTPASVFHSYKILTLSIGSKFQLLVSPLSPDSGPKYTYQLLLA